MKKFLAGGLGLLWLVIVGCGGGGGVRPSGEEIVLKEVGSEGDIISWEEGEIIIPPYSLTERISFSVREVKENPSREEEYLGKAYQIVSSDPDGILPKPIFIGLKYDELELPEGTQESSLILAYFDGESFAPLASEVDQEKNVVYGLTRHLSVFAIFSSPINFIKEPSLDLLTLCNGENYFIYHKRCDQDLYWDMGRDICYPIVDWSDLENKNRIRIMTANVGNISCITKKVKLCNTKVEARIKRGISLYNPDLIVFQEILPSRLCGKARIGKREAGVPFIDDDICDNCSGLQISRILDDKYFYQCEPRNEFECIAYNWKFNVDSSIKVADPIEDCDPGFTVSKLVLERNGLEFVVINAHLQSEDPKRLGDDECRIAQIKQIFDLVEGYERVIILGDFNLEIENEKDDSARVLKSFIEEKGFKIISPLEPTTYTGKIYDYVITNLELDNDNCYILSDRYNLYRLDGGDGMDHRAIICDICDIGWIEKDNRCEIGKGEIDLIIQ